MDERLEQVLLEASNGNEEAFKFCCAWINYCHAVDDIIDGDVDSKEEVLRTFIMALEIYSSNFYVKHYEALFHLVRVVTSTYADSVAMECSNELWQKEEANIIRSCGNDVIFVVASICGGYSLVRQISPKLRKLSYRHQRKEQEINV